MLVANAAFAMDPSQGAAAPVITDTQVTKGRLVYGKACAICHGANLEGAAGVALSGGGFAKSWGDGQHLFQDFYDVVATTMPKNAPGSLSKEDNLAAVAFILAKNGYEVGTPLAGFLARAGGADKSVTASAASSGPAVARYPQAPQTVEESVGRSPVDTDLLQSSAGNWLTFNRNLFGDRYSPLTQISTHNSERLQLRCALQLGELGSFETSPIVYNGRMFVTTAHKVFAADAATCKVFWSYTYVPLDPEHLPGNRGVALYRGKVFRGTTDGHLIALDAENGKLLWDARVGDGAKGYEITGAPVAFDGKVFTGDAGADVGINGRIYAFDASTGAAIWAFDVIPTGKQAGADTWGSGAEHGGGATWSSMAIDPERRLLFVPTGNPAPDFNDKLRPGANLYTDAVVALSLDTGKLAGYVQQVAHDVHDWDTAAAPALFDRQGRHFMAVTSKNGLLYIYDRDNYSTLSQTQFTTRENVDVPLRSDALIHVCPGALGQFNGPAYSPPLNMLFVGAGDRCNDLQMAEPRYTPGSVYFGGIFKPDPKDKQSGWFKGFDATTGREIWSIHQKEPILAGVTPTAGGLLLAGDLGGLFQVLDARTGKSLYQFQAGGPIAGGISTYLVGNKQYIAVPAGNSSRDAAAATAAATMLVFSLP
jgi:alcohol dehydrogenase (cytochrome c)